MKITRDVVTDLWPLYLSGEASADTRKLVDEFLAEDAEFARRLREDDSPKLLEPLSVEPQPDHEMKTFSATKRALVKKDWPLFFAMLFSALAFGRIVSDTSWDPEPGPRRFIVTASLAGVFWIVFFYRTIRRLSARA